MAAGDQHCRIVDVGGRFPNAPLYLINGFANTVVETSTVKFRLSGVIATAQRADGLIRSSQTRQLP